MPEKTGVEKVILAAFERDPAIDVHHYPIRAQYDPANRVITLEGDAKDVIAKKRAYRIASDADGVEGVIDRLRVVPAEPRGDGAIRDEIVRALFAEPALRDVAIRVHVKGSVQTAREAQQWPEGPEKAIEVAVHDGVVTLTGHVDSLADKRLAGALACWAPGARDVVNGLQVVPPEEDNDGEIADALRVVLEKDPLVHADRIAVRVRNGVVTLAGTAANEQERRMAELDAWCLFGVDRVVNRIQIVP
jgi:osmotically-inducible protein OsmY